MKRSEAEAKISTAGAVRLAEYCRVVLVGQTIEDAAVRPMDELKAAAAREGIEMGILTFPTAPAQQVADQLVESGIKAVLDSAPTATITHEAMQNLDLPMELDGLSSTMGCLP